MVLVLGTNAGFVTEAPVSDPVGGGHGFTVSRSFVMKDTSPEAENQIITEIGFYIGSDTEEVNFEVGLYAADGAVVPGEAGTLLEVSRTNTKTIGAGWKKVIGLNWAINSSTDYWLGVQIDKVTDVQYIDLAPSGGLGEDLKNNSTLPNPFGGGALHDADGIIAVYAVWEEAPTGTNMQINIGDAWKAVPAMKINIGDDWKAVEGAQIVIDDGGKTWKTLF